MKQILHAVQIHATPAAVYRAITTKAGLSQWWTTRVEADEREDGIIRFTFHSDFHPQMRQTQLASDRRIDWRCIGGHPNWMDNTFVFALDERKGETMLLFTQDYARELSNEVYGTYNFNWGYYLHSLKLLCEKGKGVPFVPPS